MTSTSRTVLVIDDDPDIREVIAQTLIDEGYQVQTLGDGQVAVQCVLAEPPALILLDLMMPKMSGWQVMGALKGSQRSSVVPVVLLSASRDLEQTTAQVGATACLAKPFNLEDLLAIVAQHIRLASNDHAA